MTRLGAIGFLYILGACLSIWAVSFAHVGVAVGLTAAFCFFTCIILAEKPKL